MASKKMIVGYARVSTLEQKKSGYGIDIQINEIKQFAENNHLRIDRIFKDEAISGTEENREELNILRNLCQNGEIEAVIFPSTDRTARSVRLSENLYYELSRHNVRLYFADMPFYDNENHSDVMLRQIKEVLAESNRNAIVERLKKGREERVKKGLSAGGTTPYGYKRRNKQLHIAPMEAHIIRTIYNLANVGHKPQAIAGYLNFQGFRMRNKKEWTQRQVGKILSRKYLYGYGIIQYGEVSGENIKLIILENNDPLK